MVDIIQNILRVFAENHLFEEGVELIGSWCFHLYQEHLGAEKFPLRTEDIDFLVPSPFHGKAHSDFLQQLEALGFRPEFKRDGSLYLWNGELKIEFITVEKSAGADKAVKIRNLGLNATPLRHVSFLLKDPITIVDKGIKILVPNPSRFCLQKLVIAARRRKIDKRQKDLQQAICTFVIVDNSEFKSLFSALPKKWRQTIVSMIKKSREELPLLRDDIDKLEFTLQSISNK